MGDPAENKKRSANTAAPFNLLWLIFFALLIFSAGTLDDIWQWVKDLPIVLEVIVWLLFLPYMVALAIWESDWAEWLRIAGVIFIALIWTGMMNSGRRHRS